VIPVDPNDDDFTLTAVLSHRHSVRSCCQTFYCRWLVTYRDGLPSTDGHPSKY